MLRSVLKIGKGLDRPFKKNKSKYIPTKESNQIKKSDKI